LIVALAVDMAVSAADEDGASGLAHLVEQRSTGAQTEGRGGNMRHVFGPVPSRRLGRSLGVDPVPLKTCNFSCIYCQLGRTRPLVARRKPFFNVSSILAQVATAIDRHGPGFIDWITCVGSGETTLFSRLGSLVRFIKSMSRLPVAVITNGSLLHVPSVREELKAADAVLPSLDAGTEELFRKINRPHPEISFSRQVDGLIDFRKIYDGKLWVEVMLLGGLNDTPEALRDLAAALERVEPDEIHISTPTRPPAEPWVEAPTAGAVERACSVFGSTARVLRPVEVSSATDIDGELADAILAIVARHPLQEREVVRILENRVPDRVLENFSALAGSGKIKIVERHGKRFWCASKVQFPELSAPPA
jgi:wyosine [tRNA(Phe)-imidazoG37] synthetase (radical SAM superfamily)